MKKNSTAEELQQQDAGTTKRGKVIYNINSILLRKYQTMAMHEYYASLMGNPEPKFIAMFYGPPGSGKSVFALQFADYFAKYFGKVLYNSHEERLKKTIRDRIETYKINARKLHFGDAIGFDQMMEKIHRNRYRMVVIDSVQYMDFTYDQLQELTYEFRKRLLSLLMISFGTGFNSPLRAQDHLFAADIKGYFYTNDDGGFAKFASRYKPTLVKSKLFSIAEEVVERESVEFIEPEPAPQHSSNHKLQTSAT